MVEPRRIRTWPVVLLLIAGLSICTAQKPEHYKIRLSPIAMDAAMKVNIAGSGAASASLVAGKLTISGTFEGLLGPATTAQIRRGSATGVRGPVIAELTISPAISGSISGTLDLNPDQLESLRKGRFYIQIASQKAPDGNLWGWLLP